MGCFNLRSNPNSRASNSSPQKENPQARNLKQEILLQIQSCSVQIVEAGESLEIAKGKFELLKISDDDVSLAIFVKVGDHIQWPLTKDEPVVKLDFLHYLFSLPMGDGEDPLNYGVTFSEQCGRNNLCLLDSFLKENSCFSCPSATASGKNKGIDWKEYAPRIENYNHFLAKAIAQGTGQIVKGIFKCSNAYANKVQKGGEMILITAAEEKNGGTERRSANNSKNGNVTTKSSVKKSLERVKKLSKMTEKMSKTMLDGVGFATGSVMKPMVKSKPGKAFLTMLPGEVLLASLDAINNVLDAAEAAEKQVLSATSTATTRMVSERFGESAGEATGDALATAGHCFGTAWNIFKIRKALNPASSVSSGVLYATKNRNANT